MRDAGRPLFHVTPPRGWMNDPNGLVVFDGEYHLFYQHNPRGDTWGHIGWGHAVSRDLVTWTHLPVAIAEDVATGTMIFTGSIVIDERDTPGLGEGGKPVLVAIYTGHRRLPDGGQRQAQHIAASIDRGRTWRPYRGNPVLDIGLADFRDPHVFWHVPSASWVMAVVLPVERIVRFYRSTNLIDWDHASDFGPAGATGGIWECPHLIELPLDDDPARSRWLLKVDLNPGHPSGGSGGQYFTGHFDGWRFVADRPTDEPRWVDYGSDFYAAMSWAGRPDRWLAWMSNWRYAGVTPTTPWRGMMSAVRRIGLRRFPDGVHLVQSPAPELRALRQRGFRYEGSDLTALNLRLAGDALQATALDLSLSIRPGTASRVELRLGALACVGVDARAGQVFVERRAGASEFDRAFAGLHSAPADPAPTGEFRLRVLLDVCSVEVFVADGRVVISDLLFPSHASAPITLDADGAVERVTLEGWHLGPQSNP